MISIHLGHSNTTRAKLRIQFPDGYPAEPVVCEVFSNIVSPTLVDKLHHSSEPYTLPIMIIETDPSNEIDDEIFIHWVLKNIRGYCIYVVCVPGAETSIPEEADNVAIERLSHMKRLFPSVWGMADEVFLAIDGTESEFHLLTYKELEAHVLSRKTKLDVEYHIKIAPTWHIKPEYYSKMNIHNRIVMGSLTNPDTSLNCTKGLHVDDCALRTEYIAQESAITARNTVNISTQFARQIAFTYDFIMSLSPELRNPLVDKWYSQFVGRPPAKFAWACDVSNANLTTIRNMFPSDHIVANDIMDSLGKNSFDPEHLVALTEKVNVFLDNGSKINKELYIDYKVRLIKIAMMVETITDCQYIDTNFNDKSLSDNQKARENWNIYLAKNKPDATPCYDLLAAVAIVSPDSLNSLERTREVVKGF